MPRTKDYNEEDVLEKAMNLFWKNGYESTSMQQLEKEMGINKFSIYASFGSKKELLQESIKCYAKKLNQVIDKLKNMPGGVDAIQQYFYDFIYFSKENNMQKGCLMTNIMNEFIDSKDVEIPQLLSHYNQGVRNIFAEKLRENSNYSEEEVQQKADYLIVAMFGFSSATKVFKKHELKHYINHIFNRL